MRNQELVDKRFDQIEGKIKTLKFLLSRQSSVQDFKNELNQMEELVDNLKSLIERDSSPLRNG
jgi:archaellum component FlaC